MPLLYYAEPIKNSIKTYQLGNHVLTQEPKDPLTTRENLKEIKSEDQNIGTLFSNNKKFGIALINCKKINNEKEFLCGDSKIKIQEPCWN